VNNHAELFIKAIEAAGLTPPNVCNDDGLIHRFSSNGKNSDDAGWYVLYSDGIPAGAFGNWREGVTQNWCSIERKDQTPAQRIEVAAQSKAMQKLRDDAKKAEHTVAEKTAAAIWAAATPMDGGLTHEYLNTKGIQHHGAKIIHAGEARQLCPWGNLSPSLTGMLLVIPMLNAALKLCGLQFITADGTKRPLTGAQKKGCHYPLGLPLTAAEATTLIICEGFATGASVHEATGLPVAVAFDCGNLEPVCKALHKLHPNATLIVAADDDHQTVGNPGLTAATGAALAVGGIVVAPSFPGNRPDRATDFNDLHQMAGGGLAAVQACFDGVLDTYQGQLVDPELPPLPVEGSTEVLPSPWAEADKAAEVFKVVDGDDIAATAGTMPPEPEKASPFPGMDERPRYVVVDDWEQGEVKKHKPGVYYCGIKAKKKDELPEPINVWICSPLHVEAVTFDGQNNNYGRLLRIKPTVGKWREWSMPMELLAGDGSELRAELLSMGVELDYRQARTYLPSYLQSEHPKRRIHCALQVGWCKGSFVLPDEVIGPKASSVIFQSGERISGEHSRAGTLAGWQKEIAARAVGNPLLMLGESASFTGPMLALCNAESGGLHLFGESSTGKSAISEAACATWGGPNFKRSWRATANGMEGAAALFNDCLLALDEISECDSREVGAIIYALGNGTGKQRASRSGSARGVTRWKCLVLSNGERTIATAMQEGGHRAKAGQAVRLLDIPVAQAYGAWDDLHGATNGAAFSDALKRAAAQHHGHAGRAFLEKLTRDKRDFCLKLDEFKALPIFATDGSEGQDKRAAGRFALIGMAGELATEYGITGWPEGAAMAAAAKCFQLWKSTRGKGNDERRQIMRQVSDFIERHGDGRFSDADDSKDAQIRDRSGWWRDGSNGRVYLFTSEGMRDALKGFDFKHGLDTLQEMHALAESTSRGERAHLHRIAGRPVKLYEINPDKLVDGDHGA
jgi:putative DNA primase/helicase